MYVATWSQVGGENGGKVFSQLVRIRHRKTLFAIGQGWIAYHREPRLLLVCGLGGRSLVIVWRRHQGLVFESSGTAQTGRGTWCRPCEFHGSYNGEFDSLRILRTFEFIFGIPRSGADYEKSLNGKRLTQELATHLVWLSAEEALEWAVQRGVFR